MRISASQISSILVDYLTTSELSNENTDRPHVSTTIPVGSYTYISVDG